MVRHGLTYNNGFAVPILHVVGAASALAICNRLLQGTTRVRQLHIFINAGP